MTPEQAVIAASLAQAQAAIAASVAQAQATIAASMDQTRGAIIASLVAGTVAVITSLITTALTTKSATNRLRREFQLDFAAERVAHEMMRTEWRLRSFAVIKIHLGGFQDDELRKILVRAGAVRFESRSGVELWGLLERKRQLLGVTKIDEDPANPPIVPNWAKA